MGNMSAENWAVQFRKTIEMIAQHKRKEDEALMIKLRNVMFPKSSVLEGVIRLEKRPTQALSSRKRKRSDGTSAITGSPADKAMSTSTVKDKTRTRPTKIVRLKINPRSKLERAIAALHEAGTIQITPCLGCFEQGRQCV